MIEKGVLRFGMSESHTFYLYYLKNYLQDRSDKDKKTICDILNRKLRWFYSATGFYDKNKKTMKNTHFTNWIWEDALLNLENDDETPVFKKYMDIVIELLQQENSYIIFHLSFQLYQHHIFHEKFLSCKHFNPPMKEMIEKYHKTIKNNNILIISSFTELIQSQIENGNFYKIIESVYPEETDYKINKVQYLKTKYTYFNDGPDNNIFETFDNYIKELETMDNDYNVVLISCGAYGLLFYKYFQEKGKIPILMGGYIQPFFGILNERTKKHAPQQITNEFKYDVDKIRDYLVMDIDPKYKPSYYKQLEGGCFW